MFNNLKKSFSKIIKKISNQGRITENHIQNILREVRISLLEADVSLYVIKKLLSEIKKKCVGKNINDSLTPGQEFIKILHHELKSLIGNENNSITFKNKKLSIFLFIGLQGVGKTTSVGKLAKFCLEQYKKKILIVSTDIYRSAAIKQLEIIAKKIKVDFFPANNTEKPEDIAKKAIDYAKIKKYDVLMIDSAGRLHIDINLMQEIKNIYQLTNPLETIFVIDSMSGQDAINVIKKFRKLLPITGIFLTKTDSNTRCGVVLSLKYITKIPIKFIGNGEKLNNIEYFNSDKIASKILGMEDKISIIESIEKKVDKKYIKKLDTEIKLGKKFNLNDFLEQIRQIKKLGNIKNLLQKFPFNSYFQQNVLFDVNNTMFTKIEAIIQSMTIKERTNPKIIQRTRKKRIALGSGTKIQDINKLLKQFQMMKKMMKNMKQGGIMNFFQKIKNMIY
ncbi:signal recognition particle protein [Buchnera aphidicola]|uniref:signal recognition particle protein n=1 Tax=Buchnera aphidicola TaxID=9 RepID=UPI0020920990|nr:signal recognition particle protein [Buchnera aphidicola]USS94383.1 signal recognition particle protein [Buchnera aphidicola (Sipha maydis)]